MNNGELSKKVSCRLWVEFIAVWFLAISLFVLYEVGVLEEGTLAHDERLCYILQTIGVILMLCLIPASLKMFNQAMTKRDKNEPVALFLKHYQKWSEIRLALLTVVVLINLSVYYTTLSSIGGFCAIIGLIVTFFSLPEKIKV